MPMPNITTRTTQSLLSIGPYALDPRTHVFTGANSDFTSFATMFGSSYSVLLYKGLISVDGDTGRIYNIQKPNGSDWEAVPLDNRRVFTYTSNPSDVHYFEYPAQTETFDIALPDDIYIDYYTGDTYKVITDFPYFETLYKMSDLVSGAISDTNYYPTNFAWTEGTTSGPTGNLTGEGMPAVSFAAIPSAGSSYSGIVTTSDQTFAGAKTFSSLITGSAGLSVTGAAVNLNANSNFAVNIATGSSTGFVTIGGSNNQSVSIATGSGIKTVSIGNKITNSSTNIYGGTSGLSLLVGTTGTLSIDSETTGPINIGTTAYAKNIRIGNSTTATALSLYSGTGNINSSSASDINILSTYNVNIESNNNSSDVNINIAKNNTSTGTNVYIGNAGNIIIGSDLSDTSRSCKIYKKTEIGSLTNNKNLDVFGNIYSTGFARAGFETYSNPTLVDIQLSDGNTHYIYNSTQTSLTISIANTMSDIFTNYSGGSFIITIKNNYTSDLNITFSDSLFGTNDGEVVTLSVSDALTYSGIILGSSATDCYLYGVIAEASQNLIS